MSPSASLRVLTTLALFSLLHRTNALPAICQPRKIIPAIDCGCFLYRPLYESNPKWRVLRDLCLRELSANAEDGRSRCRVAPFRRGPRATIAQADEFFSTTTRECVFSSSSSYASHAGSTALALTQAGASGASASATTKSRTGPSGKATSSHTSFAASGPSASGSSQTHSRVSGSSGVSITKSHSSVSGGDAYSSTSVYNSASRRRGPRRSARNGKRGSHLIPKAESRLSDRNFLFSSDVLTSKKLPALLMSTSDRLSREQIYPKLVNFCMTVVFYQTRMSVEEAYRICVSDPKKDKKKD